MNRYLLTTLILLILSVFSSCKKNQNPQSGECILLHGSFGAICSNSNNEIMIFGNPCNGSDTILNIVKTDPEGSLIYEKAYHFNFSIHATSVIATDQDEYYLVTVQYLNSYLYGYDYKTMLIKLNDNADTLFTKEIAITDYFIMSTMVRSADKGLIILLSATPINENVILEVSQNGDILSKTLAEWGLQYFVIADYPNGSRYIMKDGPLGYDSLRAIIHQFDKSGSMIKDFFLTRDNPVGKAFFSSQENNILWLYPEGTNVGVICTDMGNHLINEQHYKVTDWYITSFYYIQQINGSNYAYGYCKEDIDSQDYHICILKLSGNGLPEKFFNLGPTNFDHMPLCIAGLNDGRLAMVYPITDAEECDDCSCSGLWIYK